jgi:hypothetical protein
MASLKLGRVSALPTFDHTQFCPVCKFLLIFLALTVALSD